MLSLNPGMLGLEYASFNAADYRNTLTMPLLVVYGTLDRSMPVEQGAQQLLQDANSVGNTVGMAATPRFWASSSHRLWRRRPPR